jgi:hypothetical protein
LRSAGKNVDKTLDKIVTDFRLEEKNALRDDVKTFINKCCSNGLLTKNVKIPLNGPDADHKQCSVESLDYNMKIGHSGPRKLSCGKAFYVCCMFGSDLQQHIP